MPDQVAKLIRFADPARKKNIWNGSLRENEIRGWSAQVICIPDDVSTNLRDTLNFSEFDHLIVDADLDSKAILIDLTRESHQISMNHNRFIATVSFRAGAVVLSDDADIALERRFARFSVKGPAVFSFIDFKPFKIGASKRSRKFSITEFSSPKLSFSNKLFSSIEFHIEKRAKDTANGDRATITYGGSVSFKAAKDLSILEIVRIGQLYEKMIFLLIGNHCGPQEISLRGPAKTAEIGSIKLSSSLYRNQEVVSGIARCWTLRKVRADFGVVLENAVGKFKHFETALEIVIDARARVDAPDRFFRLVKALESIGRNLYPDGSEDPPGEVQKLHAIAAHSPELQEFISRRVAPIFTRRNNLGYAIEFAKKVFPFYPVTDIDKRAVTRLRNLEAHAATHVFTSNENQNMAFYAEVLDFVCSASILMFLGLSLDNIIEGLPLSRFAWFIRNEPSS